MPRATARRNPDPETTLFVSHSHEDAALAKRLKDMMEEKFLHLMGVFVSSEDIQGGDRWMQEIEKHLNASSFVLVLCSHSSIKKPWVAFEAGGGFFAGKTVVPVCLSGLTQDELGSPLNTLHAIELTEGHLNKLLSQLAEHLRSSKPKLTAPRINSAEVHRLITGENFNSSDSAPFEPVYAAVSIGEIENLLLHRSDHTEQAAVERALLAFEYTYDSSYFRSGGPKNLNLEQLARWGTHFKAKLRNADLLFADPPEALELMSNLGKLSAYLESLAEQNGWTRAAALFQLESLFPNAIPRICRDLLSVSNFEASDDIGWRIQADLVGLLAVHEDPLVLRSIGTLGRRSRFAHENPLTNYLVRAAQEILDDRKFEQWFLDFGKVKYEAWLPRYQQMSRNSEIRELRE